MGGEDDWDGVAKTDRQWTLRIFDFMERYPNVYADISHILYRKEMPSLFRECFNNNDIVRQRALYGTDFYMITTEGKFKEIRMRFISEVGSEIMKSISVDNPIRFLGLENFVKNGKNNDNDEGYLSYEFTNDYETTKLIEDKKHILVELGEDYIGANIKIYVEGDFLCNATVGSNGVVKITKSTKIGKELLNSMKLKKDIFVECD